MTVVDLTVKPVMPPATELSVFSSADLQRLVSQPRLAVIGSGRCGTGFVSQVLNLLDVPFGHEDIFSYDGMKPGIGLAGDASWMGLPYLEHDRTASHGEDWEIIHLVRNPLDVFNSLMGIRFFDPKIEDHTPYRAFASTFFSQTPDIYQYELEERTALWMRDWIDRCHAISAATVRAEGLLSGANQFHSWGHILRPLGMEGISWLRAEHAVDSVGGSVNTRRRADFTWDTVPKEIRDLGQEYGYYEKPRRTVVWNDEPPVTVVIPHVSTRPIETGLIPTLGSLVEAGFDGVNCVIVVDRIEDTARIDEAWNRHRGLTRNPPPGAFGLPLSYVIQPGPFSRKVNEAWDVVISSQHPRLTRWLLVVGDDVRFRPGWLTHALLAAKNNPHAKVIGTNDLVSERVRLGRHATHFLIDTDYIRDVGASWAGPNIVCHEGYRHWFVDDEIITAAKDRGVFVAAPDSIIEHMHPYVHKGEWDDVYQIGKDHSWNDRAIYRLRWKLYSKEGQAIAP